MTKHNSGLGSAAAAARPKPGTSVCGEAIIDTQNPTESALIKQASFTADEEFARESDRRFFSRFQERRHCIRPACRSEVAKLHRQGQAPLPQGAAWFAIVKRTGPNCCMRTWFPADEEMIHVEAGEDDALAIWEDLCALSEVSP